MKKVLIIFEESRIGGPQKHFLTILNYLKSKIKILFLINTNNSKNFANQIKKKNIQYQAIKVIQPQRKFYNLIIYFLLFFSDILKIKKKIILSNCDLVHVVGGIYSIKSLVAAILAKKKIILHAMDTYSPLFLRLLFNFFSKYCDFIIFASNKTKKFYKVKSNIKSKVIFSPVNIKKNKKNYNYKNKKIIIGTTCNISPVKGIDFFINLAEKMNKKYPNKYFFEVHGKTFETQKVYCSNLKKKIKNNNINNIKIFDEYSDVTSILKRFDIFFLSSWSEAAPTSLAEAMCYGLPCVATNVGDTKKIFKGFDNIVNFGDINSACNILNRLSSNYHLRENLGIFSRSYSQKKYSPSIIASEQILVYQEVI